MKLRLLTLASLLLFAVASACTPPGGPEIESVELSDISIEDAAAATVKAMSVASAVESTIESMAPEATETPTPQPIGKAPVPKALVPTPTVVIESAATSTVTSSAAAVTLTATVVIQVPTSTVTAVSLPPSPVVQLPTPTSTVTPVSLPPSPVVQVATPTSSVSASIATVIPTVIPTATVAITPVPVPTPIPTPEPVKIQFREGTFNIPSSFEYFEIKGFVVENIKELNAIGPTSAAVKWGDSNEWEKVSINAETGEIVAGHMYRSGGTFYADIKITSESGELFLHSFSIFVNGAVTVIQTPPSSTVTGGVTPTFTPTIGPSPTPTSTPTVGPTPTPTPTPIPTATPTPTPTPAPVYNKILIQKSFLTSDPRNQVEYLTAQEIFVMDSNGANLTMLTEIDDYLLIEEGDLRTNKQPAWSPDGTKIAFVSTRDATTGAPNHGYSPLSIYVMHSDGSNETLIKKLTSSHAPTSIHIYRLQWSPDGTKLVFHANLDRPRSDIYTMNIDGSNLTNMTQQDQPETEHSFPHWSPDGRIIWHSRVVESSGSGSNESKYEIWTMDDDGSNKTRKLYDSNANYRHPRWSPDGTKLAFFTYQGNASSGGDNWVIKVVNSDGSGLTQVYDFQTGGRAWPSFDWSPDGSSIAFIKLASSNNYAIFSINTDGSNLTQLTNTPDDNEAVVDWGPAAP